MLIITNNQIVMNEADPSFDRSFVDGTYEDVLLAVRDRIHKGHRLLTHPLSGSVKPGQTPYKSILISKDTAELHIESLKIIEDSIRTYSTQTKGNAGYRKEIREAAAEDFREVDARLFAGALESAARGAKPMSEYKEEAKL